MKYILFAILLYIAYQFIFRLVIPIYFASKKFRQGIREMQSQMEEQQRQQEGFTSTHSSSGASAPGGKAGEYIDFEEVK